MQFHRLSKGLLLLATVTTMHRWRDKCYYSWFLTIKRLSYKYSDTSYGETFHSPQYDTERRRVLGCFVVSWPGLYIP